MSSTGIPQGLRGPLVALLSCVLFALAAWSVFGARLFEKPVEGTVQTVDLRDKYDNLMSSRSRDPNVTVEPIMRNGVAWPGLALTKASKETWTGHFGDSMKVNKVFDPDAYYIPKPNNKVKWRFPEHPQVRWVGHTNSWGMRGQMEPSEDEPDLRVIVVGDSHIEGVCRDHETYPAWLGRYLKRDHPDRSIESFNAGVGGYDPYNYLGMLEKVLPLKPDVFVMTIYGGNDFKGGLYLRHFFTGTKGPRLNARLPVRVRDSGINLKGYNPQEIEQAVYFLSFPDQALRATEMVVAITHRVQEICEENGIELICVYLPPPMRVQPQYYRDVIDKLEGALYEFDDPLASSDEIADEWLKFVEEREITSLDMRPIYAAADEQLYWVTDSHINLEGQRLIAENVRPLVEQVLIDKIGSNADDKGQK